MWLESVYDRTLTDLQNRTAKAFMNVADWVRIYGNSQFLKTLTELLAEAQIPFITLTAPGMGSIARVSDINQLIENIDRIRAGSGMPAALGLVVLKYDYQAGAGEIAPDYQAANDWERDLELVRAALVRSAYYRINCGVPGAGQPRFWQSRWRTFAFVPPAENPARRARTGAARAGANLTRQNGWRKYD